MLSQVIIDQVRDLDLVEAIRPFLDLKPSGNSGFKAVCPFHDDHDPSLKISQVKNGWIWKCFPCGKGGKDAIDIVMKVKGIDFYDAVKTLAQHHQIAIDEAPITPEEEKSMKTREQLFNVNQWAAEWFRGQLRWPENEKIMNYLTRERKWSEDTIDEFGLGYAPKGFQNLKEAAKQSGYSEELLLKAGLISRSKKSETSGTFDFFSDRVIFPVHNRNGRIVAFTGRILPGKAQPAGKEKSYSRYLNSPETEVFKKSEILYGFHIARKHLARERNIYLVEGQADVITLHQLGIENTVCMSGTSLSPENLKLIKGNVDTVTLIPDTDRAGMGSAKTSATLIMKEGIYCKILLPDKIVDGEKQDPDSFFKDFKYKKDFQLYESNHSDHYILWYAKDSLKATDPEKKEIDDPGKKANLKKEIADWVKCQPELSQSIFVDKLKSILKVTKKELNQAIAVNKEKATPGSSKSEKEEENHDYEKLKSDARKYIRVRTDFYKRSFTLTSKKEKTPALFFWKKGTITEDHGHGIIKMIQKYDSFVNIPDNTDEYQEVHTVDGNNYFNLYEKCKFNPEPGSVSVTLTFLKHIFQDKIEVALDYLKLLYEHPVQKLPVICLVSKIQETGKSTFLRWVCNIFDGNGIILGNEDFAKQFNTHYAGKLIIGIDESFIDKALIKEKIKRLVTDQYINMEAKGRDTIKVDFIGKFILLSNKETNFIQMEDEDNRFFVCKVPQIRAKDPDIDKKLMEEIPAFLSFLKQRPIFHERRTRLWFDPKDYETEAMKRIVMTTKSKVEKEILNWAEEIFDSSEDVRSIKIIPRKLADELQPRLKSYNGLAVDIEHILKNDWELIPEKNQKFLHPVLKEEFDDKEKMMISVVKNERHTGKPYLITKEFIEKKKGTAYVDYGPVSEISIPSTLVDEIVPF